MPTTRRRRGYRGRKDSPGGPDSPPTSTSGGRSTTPLRRGSSPHFSTETVGLHQLSIEELKKARPDLEVRAKTPVKSRACDFCGLPFVPARRDMCFCDACISLRAQHRKDLRARAKTQTPGIPPPLSASSPRSSRHRSVTRRPPRSISPRSRSRNRARTPQANAPAPILKKASNVSFAPFPQADLSSKPFSTVTRMGGGDTVARDEMDSDGPPPGERSLPLPTMAQQFKSMDAVRLKLLPARTGSNRFSAETGRCAVTLWLAVTLSAEHDVTSMMEKEARERRALTLEAVWTLHDTHKSIEERIYLINEGCLVCSECGITQPHIVALQAHRIKVHGPKRLRAASRALLREHAPEALRIKADRFSSFMALYEEFCTMEAHLQRAQASAMAGGPPWPQPTFRSPPHPTPFPGIATKLIPSQATPAPPTNPLVDSVSEPFKILLDLGPERAGYATIPCPPDSSFQHSGEHFRGPWGKSPPQRQRWRNHPYHRSGGPRSRSTSSGQPVPTSVQPP